jgi:hypothetical protein
MLTDAEREPMMADSAEGAGAKDIGWPIRTLGLLLTMWEPIAFAVAAAGAFNAIAVRGAPVILVLAARLATTLGCVVAGRALVDRKTGALNIARGALICAALVQIYAATSRYFPSNRPPEQTAVYVGWTIVYYFGWTLYLSLSKKVIAAFR